MLNSATGSGERPEMRKAAPFSLCSSAMRGQVLSHSRMAVMVAFSLISAPSLPRRS
nr:MAG TPA: hypothetical protein [Caudoviricetes sp.]